MKINEIQAKSILNKSKFGSDFMLNTYVGCNFGCIYCYNQTYWDKNNSSTYKWGEYINVKTNAPEILSKELNRYKQKDLFSTRRPTVFISTSTDPYNPLEKKYGLTRKCLEIILGRGLSVIILTKSDLVLRDIDLFKKFARQVEIGITITTLDTKTQKILEPLASSIKKRIIALKKLSKAGIKTAVNISPVIPYLTRIKPILRAVNGVTQNAYISTFNPRGCDWKAMKTILEKHYPELTPKIETLLFAEQKLFRQKLEKGIIKLNTSSKQNIRLLF